MTPEEVAALHPRLFHVTTPGAWPSITARGLLSTCALLDLFGIDGARRTDLTTRRRPVEVPIAYAQYGDAVLNDNLPLSERALAGCLDDGLRPEDWLRRLNERVFFWDDEAGLNRLLSARMNRDRAREVLVFDTLGLVRANADRVEISPINSGATIRRPAHRGLQTFTPLHATGNADWRRQRGGRDRILELVVRGGVPDFDRHLIERREIGGA